MFSEQRPWVLLSPLQCMQRAALCGESGDLVVKSQTLGVPVLLCNFIVVWLWTMEFYLGNRIHSACFPIHTGILMVSI